MEWDDDDPGRVVEVNQLVVAPDDAADLEPRFSKALITFRASAFPGTLGDDYTGTITRISRLCAGGFPSKKAERASLTLATVSSMPFPCVTIPGRSGEVATYQSREPSSADSRTTLTTFLRPTMPNAT